LPRSRKSCVGRGFARASSQSSRASIRRIAVVVDDPTSISAARDPDDDYLVALTRQHTVDYIVTGDKNLLEWDDQAPPAITPAAFEDLLSAR
jgi:predicted nucleic acid-binding protein